MNIHHAGIARRTGFWLIAVLAWMAAGSANAAPITMAVLSLIGDKLEIVVPQMATGSRLDQNRRAALDDQSGAFDRFTLKAAADAIAKVDSRIATELIGMAPSRLHDQPERIFDGKQVALPGAIVDELERLKANYLLLITKHRDDSGALRRWSLRYR